MVWMFGQYLQRLLQKKGWTIYRLSKSTKISHIYLSQLINADIELGNKPPKISVDILTRLADALETTDSVLLIAYRGKDPDKVSVSGSSILDVNKEIEDAASKAGLNIKELPTVKRRQFESSIARMSRKFIRLVVEEEIEKRKAT